ncbi:MAG: rhamnogalacturonan acetylesterase [Bacteroidales bacterium]|nr:rhamnogalacturonan acetylesterase [Bacteroidales bacterium]
MKLCKLPIIIVVILLTAFTYQKEKPTIYIIGDSTVKCGWGEGDGGLWGWGDPIAQYFNSSQINVENHARGGTSSRTYRTLGLWQPVLDKIKKGDYVLMQFGHNDNGPVNDTIRARGTIKGIGDETEEINNMLTGEHEIVHSFGWYMTQFIKEAKAKGATPIIMSPIPFNDWKDGKVDRHNAEYGLWAKQVAEKEGILFIDLNQKMATVMEKIGQEDVMCNLYYKRDHCHTAAKGAMVAASLVVEGIKEADNCELKNYLLKNPVIKFPVKKRAFLIGDSTVMDGKDSTIGWGRYFAEFMDTNRIIVFNKARGGRSTRTFIYEGLWDKVYNDLQPGDFVLIEFGHNDDSPVEGPKYRGTLKGTGNETKEVTRDDGTKETVHTYGWYMKKYITDIKNKEAIPILLSPTPRNEWQDGKVERRAYNIWAKEVADDSEVWFIDHNELIALKYEELGKDSVKTFFPKDHTHTNAAGARLNAQILSEAIKNYKGCPLRSYAGEVKCEKE